MPHSHHSHSGQFCRHAKDQLEDVIVEAIRQGFEVFGLSEHAPRWRMEDLFPEEADLASSDLLRVFEQFLSTAGSLRYKYASQISLLTSLETDYITLLDSEKLSILLEQHSEIDYIVGSVHHVNGVSIDFDRPTWLRAIKMSRESKVGRTMDPGPPPVLEQGDPSDPHLVPTYVPDAISLQPFLEAYFDSQYDLIMVHEPEVLGHIDLCCLWTPDVALKTCKKVWEKVERNVRAVVAYGGLFEANAAAIRKGWETSYPCRDLVLDLGGKICLSDDSHGVSHVGLNYLKMAEYLKSMRVKRIWYLVPVSLRQEGDEDVGKRRRVVTRPLDDWYDHPFWSKMKERIG
nr:histidinol-phosphatase (PHP family) [Cryptococcus depauperatus CBS 7841]